MSRLRRASTVRGVALVETALVMPVVLWLALASFDFGRVLIAYIELQEAAHEGAIYGSFQPSGPIESRVRTSSAGLVDLADPSVTVDVDVDCPADTVGVTVGFSMPLVTPLIGPMFGGSLQLESESVGTIFEEATCSP